MTHRLSLTLVLFAGIWFSAVSQKKFTPKQIEALKAEVSSIVEANHKQSQVMVDKVFSFAELGFQEVESSKYLTGILEKQGFKIERGISGIPTAWFATWSNGPGPVIAGVLTAIVLAGGLKGFYDVISKQYG